jgi:acyl carrier protein
LSKHSKDSLYIAKMAIKNLSEEMGLDLIPSSQLSHNIFDNIDSFAVVELLMITEALLEEEDGVYVPLADERIFDAEHTPLRSLEDWAAYIAEQRARA